MSRTAQSPIQPSSCYLQCIRCVCKTQFCYVCRAKWKTCECAYFPERYLAATRDEDAQDFDRALAEAAQIHDNELRDWIERFEANRVREEGDEDTSDNEGENDEQDIEQNVGE
jgi:hypothetical protein